MNNEKELPPFRRAVRIRFLSLRARLGSNGGVIHDCDVYVERVCYRVKNSNDPNGWIWKIKGENKIPQWDWAFFDTDKVTLGEVGSSLEFEFV